MARRCLHDSRPFDTQQIDLALVFHDEVGCQTEFAERMREHVASRVGGIERLSAPRSRLQKSEQLGQRAQSFLRDRLDLIFDDRVKAEPVHLPAALSFSEELAPRCALRHRLAGQDLVGSGVHTPTPIRIPH